MLWRCCYKTPLYSLFFIANYRYPSVYSYLVAFEYGRICLWNLNLKLELVYSLMDILSSSLPRGSMGEGRLIWKFTCNGKCDVSLEECLAQQSH